MTEATCPKCNGSTRRPWIGDMRYKNITAGYDAATDTLACDNCGGQTMSMCATGMTTIDPATGLGCMHEFAHTLAGNCYHRYDCRRCGDRYHIDSGD